MTYEQVVKYLYSRPYGKVKLGLERIEELLDKLGNPQDRLKVIHIAGTNGKGSVTKILSQILMDEGKKVGSFFSPHLITFRERIRINDKLISPGEVVEEYERLIPLIEDMDKEGETHKPSFFEVITAMAFELFRKNNCELAVIEVGLGGLYDATNVVKDPLVSIITNIDWDHSNILGNTLPEIAEQKAGIIKQGCPVVCGEIHKDRLEVIEKRAKFFSSKLVLYKRDFDFNITKMVFNENLFDYHGINQEIKDIHISLNGAYQFFNTSIAIAAMEIVSGEVSSPFKESIIRKALTKVKWEGRMECLMKEPLVIADGAHNLPGVRELYHTIKAIFPSRRVIMVVGILRDKDITGMLKYFSDMASKIVLTAPKYYRAAEPETLGDVLYSFKKDYEIVHEVPNAVDRALSMLEDYERDMIVISGSLYTVGEARKYLIYNTVSEKG
ncbi:MAG: bifunctional folylpolyglutamate synthase/dihydrofolate synthase [Thermotoga sp.]|nr:MAG: bifunctional folylpolyglutamate synthase/dihydrofolate synthase [Thermotoga sp.]